MDEIWKDIEGYEGLYQVSNLGRVKSLDRVVERKDGKLQTNVGSLMRQRKERKGYLSIMLSNGGKRKVFKIHRLVAQAFIPNPNNLPQINHKDENPSNNRVDNLEWCDCKYNINYGSRNRRTSNTLSRPVLQINPSTMEVVREWPSTQECKRNGFIGIGKCCLGDYNQAYGYIWQYKDGNTERNKALTNNNCSKAVLQIDPNTMEVVKEWPSAMECKRNGYNNANIGQCCLGKRKQAYGFIWRYKEDVSPTSPPNEDGGPTPHPQGENGSQPNPRPK